MHLIPGFDGYYLDDSLRVISRHGRPLAVFHDKDGYPRVNLATARGKNARRTHRGLHQIGVSSSTVRLIRLNKIWRHINAA
jgi:hypothetical protein